MAKKLPIKPANPERICCGCDRCCPAGQLMCGKPGRPSIRDRTGRWRTAQRPKPADHKQAEVMTAWRVRPGAACLEWRVFSGDHFPVTLALSGMTLNELQGRLHDYDDFGEAVNDKDYAAVYTFIEPDYGNDLPPSAEDFTCGNSQHPLDDVTRGEKLIKDVYEKIRNSPLWDKSLLLVTCDEHGGFYDHVPPPPGIVPGDGVADEDNVHHHFRFDQLGVRVPALVISPLIERGTLDGTVYDHASLLATVEALFGLKPLTARDADAGNLLKLLTRATPRTDAPTQLAPAAVSGFTCDDDPAAGAKHFVHKVARLLRDRRMSAAPVRRRWRLFLGRPARVRWEAEAVSLYRTGPAR
jgi:hypothetical protein